MRPKFIIAGLVVPTDAERAFRRMLSRAGVAALSTALRPITARPSFTLAAPDSLALWAFLDAHLSPVSDS